MNFFEAHFRDGATVAVAGATLSLRAPLAFAPFESPAPLGIRPEHLEPVPRRDGAIEALVEFSEYLGHTRYLYCIAPDDETLVVEQRNGADLDAGALVWLACDPANLRFFRQAALVLLSQKVAREARPDSGKGRDSDISRWGLIWVSERQTTVDRDLRGMSRGL